MAIDSNTGKNNATTRHAARVLALTLVAAQMAYATPASALVLRELSTPELAEMRGKFISRGKVQYFGLTMHTQWDHAGNRHDVNMNVSMDMSKSTPSVSTSVSGSLGEVQDKVADVQQIVSETRQQASGAIEKISGTVQNIQAAGNNNKVSNSVSLNVSNSDNNRPSSPSVNQANSSSGGSESRRQQASVQQNNQPAVQQTTSVTQTPQSFQNKNGVVTKVHGNGNLGYTVGVGGNQVVQQLGLNGINNARQLLQSVRLHGDAHRIVNSIKMDVGFSSGRDVRTTALRLNDSLRGIR